MNNLSRETMIRAMRTNDSRYDGRFYVGVYSTGIYCLPSCTARLPLLRNAGFYFSREEAMAAGLRGCKRCRSAQYPDRLPSWLHILLGYMRENSHARLSEGDLMQLSGVDMATVRRYFRKHLGTTPLAFHRRIRLLQAKRLIESGAGYLQAAYDCGWESSSGFREAYKREFGITPGRRYA